MTTARAQNMFLAGLLDAYDGYTYWEEHILPMHIKVPTPKGGDLEYALVLWDALHEGGFDFEKLREHLKATRTNLNGMGRLVGMAAFFNAYYTILKRDNHLRGKQPDFYFYRDDTEVWEWTAEMTRRAFHIGVMRGSPSNAPEVPGFPKKRLYDIEPDRFGWFAQKVITHESIVENDGEFGPGAWLEVYDVAIPDNVRVPDLRSIV